MIEYESVTLREIEKRDMELLRGYLNDPDMSSSVIDYAFPVSSDMQDKWFANRLSDGGAIRFMIEAQGETIGTIIFARIDPVNKTGIIGYKVARDYRGKNYATYALCALQRYLLDETDTECIESYHFKTNIPSRRVLEKAGFVYEGVRREYVYKHGKRQDVVYWSSCRDQFNAIRKDRVKG